MDIQLELKKPESQERYNANRFNQLRQHPLVVRFLSDHNLNEEFLKNNLSKFDRYIKYQENDHSMKSFEVEGYDLELVYENGLIDFQYVLSEDSLRKQKENAHLANYWINHLPQSFYQNRFDLLDLENETPNYLSVLSKLIDLSFLKHSRGVFLFGDVGCGKTHLMSCLANKVASENHTVCFVKVTRLLNDLKSSFNLSSNDYYEKTMAKMMVCDLLIFDDIGAENPTLWSRDEIIFSILDYRMENQKLTCFTSNLDNEAIYQHYLNASNISDPNKADRLMERIIVLSEFMELKGMTISRRIQKL